MKRHFFSLVLILLGAAQHLLVDAQVTIDTNSSAGSPHLILYENDNDFARMYFQNTNSTAGEYWSIAARVSPLEGSSRLHFYNNGSSNSGYVLSMTGSNRVGIGTIHPEARLTIDQEADESNSGIRINNFQGVHNGRLWMNGGDFHIQRGADDLNGFVIKPNRFIGVFTENPTAKFEIHESSTSANDALLKVWRNILIPQDPPLPPLFTNCRIIEAQEDCDVYIGDNLGVRVENPTDLIHINSNTSFDNPFRVQVDGATKFRVLNNGGTSIGSNNEDPPPNGLFVNERLLVGTSSLDDSDIVKIRANAGDNGLRVAIGSETKLRVLSNGGTSIGSNNTSPPENGLYVNGNLHIGTTAGAAGYKMSVNGKVICEELTVELSGDWPDYVFQDDYKLMPLSEVEKAIIANLHLPGVPPAAEIEKSGIHMSEISATLLRKIEELTLYIIEQEKSINQLQEQLEALVENDIE